MFDFALLQRFVSVVMIFHVQNSCLQTIAAAIIKDLLLYITERKVANKLLFQIGWVWIAFYHTTLKHHYKKQLTFFILNVIFNWISLYLGKSLSLPYCILVAQTTKFNSSNLVCSMITIENVKCTYFKD